MKKSSRSKIEALEDFSNLLHNWLSDCGRKGGSVSSAAKTQAAIANGRKGGRPRHTVCRDCQFGIWTVRSGRKCSYKLDPRTCPYCRPRHETSVAVESKAKRTGRSLPASVGRGPSKTKKRT